MSTHTQWLLLLRLHWRLLQVKLSLAVNRSRLMTLTVASFLVGYMVAAYFLFRRGLDYVISLPVPAAGTLLGDRLIHVLFFCFLMMLIFSISVTAYISLFRSRDTRWLLTLPISHRTLFLWKCFESAVFSSWGLLFILAPLILAFAQTREVGPDFFVKTTLLLICFLVCASALGSLLLITAVRWLNRRQIGIGLGIILLFFTVSTIRSGLEDRRIVSENAGASTAFTFQRILKHTRITVNRAIPSVWVASPIVDWTRPYRHSGQFLYPCLLLSHALFAILLLSKAGERWFYQAWNQSLQNSAIRAMRKEQTRPTDRKRIMQLYPRASLLARLIGRPAAAISRKDFLTFIREPSQWIQFSLVFGLLALYSTGLRKMNNDLANPRDLYLVAFLNLSVCALALSTLTTRFVFPQFSLEGRRLWILAMSPLPLSSIVTQKFITSTLWSSLIVIGILSLGGYNLQLGLADTAFFTIAIAMLALGLNGLAVGLGVLFPNLRESNSAKIVSSFGGTLCLIISFLYILTFILLLAFLRWDIFKNNEIRLDWYQDPIRQLGLAALLILTLSASFIPIIFSQKMLKRLEILINS